MNKAALEAHQKFWHVGLRSYPILRIVGREPTKTLQSSPRISLHPNEVSFSTLRIVSVGRLVPFKGYNIGAAEIIRRLRDVGVDVTWDIWGYGPDEQEMLRAARKFGVDTSLRIHGALPHDEFDSTVHSYDVFVGMGTAVLEAAKTGVPSIVAIENSVDASYGFLHQAPIDSVGDRVEGYREIKIFDVLLNLAKKTHEERANLGQKDAIAARSKESTVEEFADKILNAEKVYFLSIRKRIVLWLGMWYLKINHFRHRAN